MHLANASLVSFGKNVSVFDHNALVLQALNVMNLLWAFDFSPAVDPSTRNTIPVDIFNYEKVSK